MPSRELYPDRDVRHADWPKRTPDTMAALAGRRRHRTLYNPTALEMAEHADGIVSGRVRVVRDDSDRRGLADE